MALLTTDVRDNHVALLKARHLGAHRHDLTDGFVAGDKGELGDLSVSCALLLVLFV